MTDLFTKICLGVIAASLAVLAYVEAASYRQETHPSDMPQQVARTEAERCIKLQSALDDTLAALEEQIRNVPANVQEKDSDGNVTSEYPNRLYEQLMLQIIETKTRKETLRAQCAAA